MDVRGRGDAAGDLAFKLALWYHHRPCLSPSTFKLGLSRRYVATIRAPAGHAFCSGIDIASAFPHYHVRVGKPSRCIPDTADFDAEQMWQVQAQLAYHAVRSHDFDNVDSSTNPAISSRNETASRVKLRHHKIGTQAGIVSAMPESKDPAILDMLAGLVDALWTTELISGHWRAGYIVNITKKGDKEDFVTHGGVTALNVVDNLCTKVINSRLLTWSDTHAGLHVCQAGSK